MKDNRRKYRVGRGKHLKDWQKLDVGKCGYSTDWEGLFRRPRALARTDMEGRAEAQACLPPRGGWSGCLLEVSRDVPEVRGCVTALAAASFHKNVLAGHVAPALPTPWCGHLVKFLLRYE